MRKMKDREKERRRKKKEREGGRKRSKDTWGVEEERWSDTQKRRKGRDAATVLAPSPFVSSLRPSLLFFPRCAGNAALIHATAVP